MTDKELVDEVIADIQARQVEEGKQLQRTFISAIMFHALMTDPRSNWGNKAFHAVTLADELIIELNRETKKP